MKAIPKNIELLKIVLIGIVIFAELLLLCLGLKVELGVIMQALLYCISVEVIGVYEDESNSNWLGINGKTANSFD